MAAQEIKPLLNITKNPARYTHYSSIIREIHYSKDGGRTWESLSFTTLHGGFILDIAKQAWHEMYALHSLHRLSDRDLPGVMTALATPDAIYLSSSLKGYAKGIVHLFPNSPVVKALNRCPQGFPPADKIATNTTEEDGTIHRTGANCGEPCAMHLFWTDPSYNHTTLYPDGIFPSGCRAVAVVSDGNQPKLIRPCFHGPKGDIYAERTEEEKMRMQLANQERAEFTRYGIGNIPAFKWGCDRLLNDANIGDVNVEDSQAGQTSMRVNLQDVRTWSIVAEPFIMS